MPALDQLPEELLNLIGRNIYNPLEMTPFGRLRCHDLIPEIDELAYGVGGRSAWHQGSELVAKPHLFRFAATCRAVRCAVRPLMFGHIRVVTVAQAKAVIEAEWAVHVRALSVDLVTMLKNQLRSCWDESALLARMINAVPQLQHLSIAANQSDNSTIALVFASLIPRDNYLPPAHARDVGVSRNALTPTTPFIERLISFEWSQEIDWDEVESASEFGEELPLRIRHTPVFVSTHHLIRHARNLEFLNLYVAKLMAPRDVLAVVGEVAARAGQTEKPLKLFFKCRLHWRTDPSDYTKLVALLAQCNLKELYMGLCPRAPKPLSPSEMYRGPITDDEFLELLRPLASNRDMSILHIDANRGWDDEEEQLRIVTEFARIMPNLIAMGLSHRKEEWRGLWRGKGDEIDIRPLQVGDIPQLEASARAAR